MCIKVVLGCYSVSSHKAKYATMNTRNIKYVGEKSPKINYENLMKYISFNNTAKIKIENENNVNNN